jgi:hypothetical protein
MYKNAYIFGSSFTAPWYKKDNIAWVDFLKNHGYHINNLSCEGVCNAYIMHEFYKLSKNTAFLDNDIVLFQFSYLGKLDLEHQILSEPMTAARYVKSPDKIMNKNKNNWYFDNKKFIRWYIANKHQQTEKIYTSAYLHMLHTFAVNNPKVNVIILHDMDYIFDDFIPIIDIPENFLWIRDLSLNDVSFNELRGIKIEEWVKYSLIDLRVNHMSKINHEILQQAIIKAIDTRSVKHINIDMFSKNILDHPIKTIEEFKDYVQRDLLVGFDVPDFYFK